MAGRISHPRDTTQSLPWSLIPSVQAGVRERASSSRISRGGVISAVCLPSQEVNERNRDITPIVAWRNYRESETRPGFESRGDPSTRLLGLSKYFTALIREFTDSRSHAMQAIANAT